MATLHVKVCGLTTAEDVSACVAAGVTALGFNLVAGTPRAVDPGTARRLVAAADGRAETVLVVADLAATEVRALLAWTGARCAQLHGDEPPSALAELLPHAYKAVRVADAADVARARAYPGGYVLVDAKVAGALGGTGVRVDPALVAPLARERRLCLAGGLAPDNVADAVRLVRPFAVDVASGVEVAGSPRRKDAARVRAFVAAARAAAEQADPPATPEDDP